MRQKAIYKLALEQRGKAYMIWRLTKLLVYLAILGTISVVAYAYVGPYFGADFSAQQTEIREPVTLNVD